MTPKIQRVAAPNTRPKDKSPKRRSPKKTFTPNAKWAQILATNAAILKDW